MHFILANSKFIPYRQSDALGTGKPRDVCRAGQRSPHDRKALEREIAFWESSPCIAVSFPLRRLREIARDLDRLIARCANT